METLGIISAIVASAVGGTWVVRSKLSDIENAIKNHITEDASKFASHEARIIKMERRRR